MISPAASWVALLAGAATLGAALPTQPFTLIETGAVWRYLDPGVVPGAGWKEPGFVDQGWKAGRAPLGYGRGNEATVLDYGPDAGAKPLTTYFRYRFSLENPRALLRVTLRLIHDDAAVVYLNGHEVLRNNLPNTGTIGPGTPATRQILGAEGTRILPRDAWPGYLTNENVLAVELHQFSSTDQDAWFDLPVVADLPYGPPIVQWVSPSPGSVLPWDDVVLEASATDEDSTLWKIEFYADGILIGEDQNEPFSVGWFDPPAGRFRLWAEAIDSTGRRAASPAVPLQLGPPTPDRVVRGPYLQSATPETMTVCWRTDWFTEGHVHYGLAPDRLTNSAASGQLALDHAVVVDGLAPGTRYYYAIGSASAVLSAGPDHSFVTTPLAPRPTRIWVIGDSGTADEPARDVLDAYLNFQGDRRTDIWLMLGDNAYESGTDPEYQRAVFEVYGRLLPNTVLWPTIGNHDDSYPDAGGRVAYLDIFTLPQSGQAGGLASGTERYYSFDHANIHLICLDSSRSDRSPGSAMLSWLEADLEATLADWVIAYWHHPPYSFGTHNSDHERNLIEMRENVLPILERHAVDLVLSGHSHNYERSFFLHGHYGSSSNLLAEMILDGTSGDPADPYRKPAGGLGAGQGAVYVVCGFSGEGGLSTVRLHPAMFTAQGGHGSLVVDIADSRLEARMLTDAGLVRDLFVLEKGEPMEGQAPQLGLRRGSGGFELSWPTSSAAYRLETSRGDTDPWGWERVLEAPVRIGRRYVIVVQAENSRRFFRLARVEP